MSHKRYLSFLLLAFTVLLFNAGAANACSCGPEPTVLDAYNYADVVVIAKVLSVEQAAPEKRAPQGQMSNGQNYVDGVMSTTMSIERVYKGDLKVGEEMVFGQGGGADCIWTFNEKNVGKQYLFYLNRFKGATVWLAVACGRSNSVEGAGDDLLYLNKLDKVRGKTRISGTIEFSHDEGNVSVEGLKIRIIGANKNYEVKTDKNGVYEIYDLPAGKYLIEPEIPFGWKVDSFWLGYSPSLAGDKEKSSAKRIPIVLQDKKHAGLDIHFEIDNAVRGHIYDPTGKPMNGVCLNLVPADGTKGPYLADCTEKGGAFEIHEIPPGSYVIAVNDDGKVTSSEPFGTFYYPNVTKREEATVFHIGLGQFIENLQIYPPISAETITVEGVFLYSDGKPVVDEWVEFKSGKAKGHDDGDAQAQTDAKGRFSIKILKGETGQLYGAMHTFIGEYENCPKLEAVIRKIGKNDFAEIKTDAVQINAENNLYGVELKYPFPSCKKAKID